MPKKRIAIYARVSKDDDSQDPTNQLAELRAWCDHGGHEIVAEYVDHETGTKGEESRQQFAQLLKDAHRRKFDLVLFWALDRFSREGMQKTVSYLQRLSAADVAFHSYTEEYLSTDNELVRDILVAVMSSLAKQEAIKISLRTKAGLARAKAKGKLLGRPKIAQKKLDAIVADHAADPSQSQAALSRKHGVAREVVKRALSS